MDEGLSFPGGLSEELEFRDGKRLVPNYIGAILSGLETHRMTYEEAILRANQRMEARYLNSVADDVVVAHMRGIR